MVATRHRYTLAQIAWGVLTLGGMIAVVSGRTEPFLSVSELAVGDFGLGLAAFGAAFVGWFLIGQLRRRAWRDAGRYVGLSPDAGLVGSVVGFPDLTGEVRGRSVRIRAVRKKSSSSSARRTLIEASLSGPVEVGLVVGRTTSGDPASATPSFGSIEVETHAVDGEFWAVGDEALAREVLTKEVRRAMRDVGEVDGVYAGDVAGLLKEGTPDVGGSLGDKLMSVSTSGMTPGDGTTVAWKRKGALVAPEGMRRSSDVVVAVADAFEAATAGGERAAETERQV